MKCMFFFVFVFREESKHLKALEEMQCVRLKETEQLAAQREQQCAAILQRVPEMEELESSASEQVMETTA